MAPASIWHLRHVGPVRSVAHRADIRNLRFGTAIDHSERDGRHAVCPLSMPWVWRTARYRHPRHHGIPVFPVPRVRRKVAPGSRRAAAHPAS